MSRFSESQLQDLRDLQRAVSGLGAEAVIIGAMAYRVFIEDSRRETFDIDLAVALDLDEFQRLEEDLLALGWSQLKTQEQRWVTPRENRLDLVPAGQSIRKQGKLVWPRSGFVMSLAGFEHVFQDATPQDIGHGLMYKVVPPSVLALLKIAAYLDDPQRRAKDLIDLRNLMRQNERDTERIFSDEVFQAELSDIEFAGAFLLGLDLRAIATQEDASLVESFVAKMMDSERSPAMSPSAQDDWAAHEASRFQEQLSAFWKGFKEPY
jgi:predicted nucleotidyltransferase